MSEELEPQRTMHHTLTEALVGEELSAEVIAKKAAKGAPFWVIAVMLHVIIGAIMGLMVIHDKSKGEESTVVEMSTTRDDTPKIDVPPPPEPEKEIERTSIPDIENTDITNVTEEFNTVVADTVNPYATDSSQRFGVSEGTDDPTDNLLTMSTGGKGLAGAIGVRRQLRSNLSIFVLGGFSCRRESLLGLSGPLISQRKDANLKDAFLLLRDPGLLVPRPLREFRAQALDLLVRIGYARSVLFVVYLLGAKKEGEAFQLDSRICKLRRQRIDRLSENV